MVILEYLCPKEMRVVILRVFSFFYKRLYMGFLFPTLHKNLFSINLRLLSSNYVTDIQYTKENTRMAPIITKTFYL